MAHERNQACTCGSGRKFKHCCGANRATVPARTTAAAARFKGIQIKGVQSALHLAFMRKERGLK
jgi:hypothetical protein